MATTAERTMVLRLSAAGAARLPADPALPPPLEVQPERREALAGYALDGTGLALLLPAQAAAPRLVALDAANPPPAPPRRSFATRLSVRRFALAPEADTLVDATLEMGTLASDDATTPVRRLTLSLRAGDPAALPRLALALHAAEPVALEAETLAAQGMRLAARGTPCARHARDPALQGSDGVGEGLRQVVLAGVAQMLGNEDAIRAGDVEGVHQMRVAVRQLRAGLRLFAPALGGDAHRPFDARLRALGWLLGEARDWDVFCTATLPEAAASTGPNVATATGPDAATATPGPDMAATATLPNMAADAAGPDMAAAEPDATAAAEPDAATAAAAAASAGWDALVAAATAERERAHTALLAHLDGPAPTQLGLELIAWAEAAPAGGPLAGEAPALLRTLARKVLRRGRHLARLPAEALHDRRKALKRLRYATDFLAALFPGAPVRRYRKRCRAVQAVLGDINDASMTAALAASLDTGEATQRLLAWNAARHEAALARLAHDWARLRSAEPFWE